MAETPLPRVSLATAYNLHQMVTFVFELCSVHFEMKAKRRKKETKRNDTIRIEPSVRTF